jgi:uncharacterized membrane protein YbhN (UPF0104 family)
VNRRLLFKLVGSAAIVALLFRWIPWQTLWPTLMSSIDRLSPGFALAIVAGFLACHAFGVLKWRMVAASAGARLPLRAACECYSAGLFTNVFLPSIVGGDVLRALLAGRRSGRMEAAILGGGADRLIDFAAVGALALAGSLAVGVTRDGASRPILALAAVLVAVVVAASLPFVLRMRLSRWPPRLRRRIARALVALRRQARAPFTLLASFAGALAIQTALVALCALIGRRIGIEAPASAWLFAWALAKLAALLPVGLNGIGPRDAAFTILFAGFITGVAAVEERRALALNASLLWQTVVVAGSLCAGAAWRLFAPAPAPAAPIRATPEEHG